MATITIANRRAIRLANTHNALSRTRPLAGPAAVGDSAMMDANGNWLAGDGTTRSWGIIIGISDGRLEGDVGDDAEVLMEGIVAGLGLDPNTVVSQGEGDGELDDAGTGQVLGVAINDGLVYIRPDLA